MLFVILTTVLVTSFVWWCVLAVKLSNYKSHQKELKEIYKERLQDCEMIKWQMHKEIGWYSDQLNLAKKKDEII